MHIVHCSPKILELDTEVCKLVAALLTCQPALKEQSWRKEHASSIVIFDVYQRQSMCGPLISIDTQA